MNRHVLIFTGLLLLSVLTGAAVHVTGDPIIINVFLTSLLLTVTYFIFSVLFSRYLVRQIADNKTRYTANKILSVLSFVFIIFFCLRIWVTDSSSLLVSYGILGAGLALALQDVFKNFAGGILIMICRYYFVGDRISIDDKYGDVMDIGLLNTTMMEIRGWIAGDQPSGRLLIIPNGLVLNHAFYNYTRDHSFVWDEISIPLTYTSDWRRAKEIVLSILKTETDAMTIRAEAEIERIGEMYYLPKKVVEPSVYISLTDNWITLDARYVTDARTRRFLRSNLSELFLAAIESEEGITVASETLTVTTIQKTPVSKVDFRKLDG
ncbi:MAG TPA: mechanosensitive ion channel domain-containing protein [Methanoregula sp.]|nr:mechanosensitive ion channel domain-containing protein [Methanoregula sp.]